MDKYFGFIVQDLHGGMSVVFGCLVLRAGLPDGHVDRDRRGAGEQGAYPQSPPAEDGGEDVTDIVGKLTNDWNLHPEEYIFYIRDDSELWIAPCTVYYEAEMRYLSYQVNGTIYEYDCEYTNDICNLVGIYTFHATPD